MPSPHPPTSALAPSDAPAPGGLEVVCRTQSADTEPTGDAPTNDPIPAPSLEKARRANTKNNNKAKIFPADAPNIQDKAAVNEKKRGFWKLGGKNSSAATVHINASAGGGNTAAPHIGASRSSSVFDLLEHQRQRPRAPWKVKVGAFLDGIPFTIISIIFTMSVSFHFFLLNYGQSYLSCVCMHLFSYHFLSLFKRSLFVDSLR